MGEHRTEFILLLVLSFVVASLPEIGIVKAESTIYIRSDGSVEGTNKIQRNGDMYYLTNNIEFAENSGPFFAGISIQKDNIIIDGKGFNIQNFRSNIAYGIDLSERFNVTIQNLNVIGFHIGISLRLESNELKRSSNNTIIGNTITGPSDDSFQVGIWASSSTGNKIIDNTITEHNQYGILFHVSNNSYISGNVISSNNVGFGLEYSTNNIFRNNQFHENEENFRIAFRPSSPFIHDIDTSNLVNYKPIYYWINQHNKTIPSNAGSVFLWNCSEIIVQNLSIKNNGNAILLFSTTDSVLRHNHLESNGYAIRITDSANINITNNQLLKNSLGIKVEASTNVGILENDIVNGGVGIDLQGYYISWNEYADTNNVAILKNNVDGNNQGIDISLSDENVISGNNFTQNQLCIRVVHSQDNLIVGNNFTENNGPAIYLSGSSNNTFYHNNFINNKVEGLQVSNPWLTINPEPSNIWDNGYEGNYWSDYASRYPNSTEVNNSNIWDVPFFINEVNIDRFPLIEPVDIELVPIPEFPSWIILPLFEIATLIVIIYRKRIT